MIFKYLILLSFLCSSVLFAQRTVVNKGVDFYKEERFTDSEVNFKKGVEIAPESFEARFNLGDAYYKQGKFDESIKEFYNSLELIDDPILKAKVHYNIGNSFIKAQKIKESIDAYKNSLKINPNDMETKYNLSYALSLLDKNQNQQQQNNQNQQNQDQNNQDQNRDQNQDNQNNQQQDEQNKPLQNEQVQQDNLKMQQNQISKEEAERILQALKNNEQEIQKKLRQKTGPTAKRDKDW